MTESDGLTVIPKQPNVLITGVSSGMGFEIAKTLAEKGFRVLGSVRSQSDKARVESLIPEGFTALMFDVTDQASIDRAVTEVDLALGSEGLCALINNAGIGVFGPLQHLDIDELKKQMDVNTFGALRVTQAFLPRLGAQLPQRYPPGKIINISSVSGLFAGAFVGAYAMSKYALEAMTDSLRRELSIYDIDCLIIEPGAIKTEITGKSDSLDPRFLETDYEPILRHWDKRLAQSEKNALPASVIATAVFDLIVNDRPPVRQIIAKRKDLIDAWVNSEDRVLDDILAGKFKSLVLASQSE